jgi:hypothetical protein
MLAAAVITAKQKLPASELTGSFPTYIRLKTGDATRVD